MAEPPFIRTVLGDIAPDDLGVCYAHEHIIIDASVATLRYPAFHLESVEKAVAELATFHAAGGRAVVDAMPCDAGRNVLKLADISRATSVHIIAPTGIHLEQYYDPGHWSKRVSGSQLADLFVADIETGIDRFDYGGPLVDRTEHHAGVIKVAGGRDRLSDHERKVFAAAGEAHRQTGCPILTHTEQGTAALEQIACFERAGVPLGKVVLSHTDRLPDPAYHREILSSGVRVEYDSCFRWKDRADNPSLDLVLELIDAFPGQILLGMDAARPGYWKHHGGEPGLAFLLGPFSERLRAGGLTDQHWQRIFVENPRAWLRFERG
ncbi:MAG: phosphotriesterase family protein [Opitutales bacterium]